jgi:hypothetical protein
VGPGVSHFGVRGPERLYNSATGTFTSMDPVFGGNPTTYAYPLDPVNGYDLNGQFGCGWCKSAWHGTTHAVKSTFNHTQYGGSYCVLVCGGVTVQGTHVSISGGGVGLGGRGGFVGYASAKAPQQGRNSAQFSASAGVGGYASMGKQTTKHKTYWAAGVTVGGLGISGGPMFSKSLR